MAETSENEQSSFSPGETLPTLGIDMQHKNGWVRWGLPIVVGLIGVLVLFYLN